MILEPKAPGGMIRVGALWTWERLSKTGEVLSTQKAFNICPTEGLNHILDVIFQLIPESFIRLNNTPGVSDPGR